MKTKERLKEYFEYTGVQKVWFARKLGMTRAMIYGILSGAYCVPRKYWHKIIDYSQGFVKAEHLIEDHLDQHFKNFPLVDIQEIEGEGKWIISAKTPEKKP